MEKMRLENEYHEKVKGYKIEHQAYYDKELAYLEDNKHLIEKVKQEQKEKEIKALLQTQLI